MRIPSAGDHVRRGRLLCELAQGTQRAAITWVSGLPGSGKTSLVARWVEDRAAQTVWYRLEESDADGARLLDAISARGQLPVWSPENRLELADFARTLFATMAAGPLTLVLDDCHRVADDAPVMTLLRAVHDVCGANLRIVAVSRRRPPPALAHGIVGGWLAVVDDLRLDAGEAAAIVERVSQRTLSSDELAEADGWLAHLMALAHGRERHVNGAGIGDFLASELLASLPEPRRAGLRRLAELPEIPDDESDCLPAETARLLASLAQQGYFVTRAAHYRLHDLLRDALLRLNFTLDSPGALRDARRTLASWVEASMPEASLQLCVRAADVRGVLRLLDAHAATWLARGLHRSLFDDLRALPEPEDARERAALDLWRAQALVPIEPEQARPLFAAARRASVTAGDVRRAYLAWSGEVSSYVIQWGAVQGLADLVDELEKLRAALGPEPDDLTLRISADALTALMYGRAEDARIGHFADTTARAVSHAPDASARIGAAAQLLVYRLWWAGDFPGGRALYDAFDREVDRGHDLPPLPRLLWWSCASIVDWQCGAARDCYDKVDRGLALAEAAGVHVRDFFLLTQGIFCALSQEDWDRAERYLAQLALTERRHRRLDVMVHHFFRSWYSLCRGDARMALAHAEAAWPIAEEIGSMFHKVIVLSALAPARVHTGDLDGAQRAYREQITLAKVARNPTFSFIAFCAGAEIALARKDANGIRKQVDRMLFVKELGGFHSACGWRTPLMRELLAFALRHDIRPDVARRWIREKRITPPEDVPEGWPLAIRIETAAGLAVAGHETAAGQKPARKLRELLAVLVAVKKGATQAELGDWLWPDVDGDKAAASLKAAVHRLRRWLGADAVLVVDGRVRLNAELVSCDLWDGDVFGDVLAGFDLPPVNALRDSLARARRVEI